MKNLYLIVFFGFLCASTLTARAQNDAVNLPKCGHFGDMLKWSISGDTLTISGTGDMPDYEHPAPTPWFAYIDSITDVIIEEGVSSIGISAFADFPILKSVIMPNSVKSIGDGAFAFCEELTSITMSDSLKRIGDAAFFDCTNLPSIVIPKLVTTLGDGVFYECTALTKVINRAKRPQPIVANVFDSVNRVKCILYVPAASRAAYRAARVWATFVYIKNDI